MNFILIRFRNRPLLAIPSSDGLIQDEAIRCYPAHTWKKKLVRLCLLVLRKCGLLSWIFSSDGKMIPGVPVQIIEQIIKELGLKLKQENIYPVCVWPGDPGRARVYSYFLNEKGKRIAFGKIALDEKNNDLISNERNTLKLLGRLKPVHFRIPKLLTSGQQDNKKFLIVEPVQDDVEIFNWVNEKKILGDVIKELSGEIVQISKDETVSQSWWQDIQVAFLNRVSLIQALDAASQDGIKVCHVHGDLNGTNILSKGSEVWLLDWERSHEKAPYLTDKLCIKLDKLWHEVGTLPKKFEPKAYHFFKQLSIKYGGHDCLLALVYLGAANFPPALSLIDKLYPECRLA